MALGECEATIAAAERLAGLERRYTDPPTSKSAPTVQALRGGFCVLIVGSFERYLAEAFSEHIGGLSAIPPPVAFADLPKALRLSSVCESLELAMKGPRHGRSRGRAERLPEVVTAAKRIVVGNVDPNALAETKGNPDAATVKRMFKTIGVPDVFRDTRPSFDERWGRPEASTFVSDKLDEVVNARHVVAHTANALCATEAASPSRRERTPAFRRMTRSAE